MTGFAALPRVGRSKGPHLFAVHEACRRDAAGTVGQVRVRRCSVSALSPTVTQRCGTPAHWCLCRCWFRRLRRVQPTAIPPGVPSPYRSSLMQHSPPSTWTNRRCMLDISDPILPRPAQRQHFSPTLQPSRRVAASVQLSDFLPVANAAIVWWIESASAMDAPNPCGNQQRRERDPLPAVLIVVSELSLKFSTKSLPV